MQNISAILMITILLPYVFTILFQGNDAKFTLIRNMTEGQDVQVQADQWVICGEGETEKIAVSEYIMGAVAASMPVTCESEALKAQSVVIRTHLALMMKDSSTIHERDTGLNYMDLADMQATWGYQDFADCFQKLQTAVDATEGQVLCYKGELIYPPFHAVSAGKTRNGNEIAGRQIYPYLQSVDSSMDLESEDYLKTIYYSKADFLYILRQYHDTTTLDQPKIADDLEVIREEGSAYVKEVILHSSGDHMSGEQFRTLFHLNSSCFYIENYEENIRIVTKGLGHGLGLSTFGANQMAKQGSGYDTILYYYYPGTSIEKSGN